MRPKKVILSVDDNEQTLSVRRFLLETRGYRVLSATSALAALEIAEAALPGSIDLLLTDLVMPQMDGNELTLLFREIHSQAGTVIVSGIVTSCDRAMAAHVFFPKGTGSPAEMLERIRVLCVRKRGPKRPPQFVGADYLVRKEIA